MAISAKREIDAWRWGFTVAGLVCVLAFLANALLGEIRSGNAWGLAYGIAATVMLAGTGLYGMRRRAMRTVSRLGLGSARAWLSFHLYGGLLFLLLVLMHSGFRLPTGALNWWVWGLAVWTVVSGLVGRGLQQWIPRALASGLSIEVHYDRIPELVEEIRERAREVAAASSAPVQALYRKKVARALTGPQRNLMYFVDITGGIRSRLKEFDYLRGFLEGEERERLLELERLYRGKLEIDAHYTLQQALRLWLWLHLPLSLLLAALVAVHIFTVIYY